MTLYPTGDGHVLGRADFAAAVERALADQAGIDVLRISDHDVEMRINGLGVRASLDTFYTTYLEDPAQLETVLNAFVQTARGFVPDRAVNSYDALKERIFPMIKPLSVLVGMRERGLPMLAYQLLLSDLIVTYVINEPKSVVYLTEAHLEHWEVSERDLHAQALANLRQLTDSERDYKTIGAGAQRLFFWDTQDGYDASRLLLTDMLMEWQAQLPGQIVIGIPNRDFLIAFSDSDRAVLEGVARQVEIDATHKEHALTGRLFTLRNAAIREYEWE